MKLMKMKDLWKSQEQIKQEEEEQEQILKHEEQKQKAQVSLINKVVEEYILAENISEEEKDLFINMFDLYEAGLEYVVGDKVGYKGEVYKVLQDHTSQLDWVPSEVPALYTLFYQVSTSTGENVIPTWTQPQGAHDVYNTGDLVEYNQILWESEVDNNVWAPGVFGWVEYTQ